MSFLAGVPGKLMTLLDRLTSTRAGYLDNLVDLDHYTEARAGKIDDIDTGVDTLETRLTAARAANLDDVGGYVNVQSGTFTLLRTETYKEVTITEVVTARSWVDFSFFMLDDAVTHIQQSTFACWLVNSTTLRFERGDVPSGTALDHMTFRWQVMEWKT